MRGSKAELDWSQLHVLIIWRSSWGEKVIMERMNVAAAMRHFPTCVVLRSLWKSFDKICFGEDDDGDGVVLLKLIDALVLEAMDDLDLGEALLNTALKRDFFPFDGMDMDMYMHMDMDIVVDDVDL
jgi:hypothetical protein